MNETTPDPWTDRAFEQSVRETAYFLWEHNGRQPGHEQEYWFEALERCLRQRNCDKALSQTLDNADGLQLEAEKLELAPAKKNALGRLLRPSSKTIKG